MSFDWYKSRWPAKLLLFGEYTVLDGCVGLGIQIPEFYLKTTFVHNMVFDYSDDICKLWRVVSLGREFKPKKSLAIDSSIPIGYGLGSSAALCLSVLSLTEKEFFPHGLTFGERFDLLRKMEAVYHTSSSGVDLLICAATGPVLINMEDRNTPKIYSANINKQVEIALLDIGPRKEFNSSFIPKVLHRFKNDTQNNQKWERYKVLTNSGIEAFLSGDRNILSGVLTELRKIQYEVGTLTPEMEKGLEMSSGVLGWKAIGAGGGGVVLVFGEVGFQLPSAIKKASVLWRGVGGGI